MISKLIQILDCFWRRQFHWVSQTLSLTIKSYMSLCENDSENLKNKNIVD